jgi:hypothetical protein
MVASIHVDWTVVLQVIGLVAILVCIFYYHTGPATNSSTTEARPPLPAALVD